MCSTWIVFRHSGTIRCAVPYPRRDAYTVASPRPCTVRSVWWRRGQRLGMFSMFSSSLLIFLSFHSFLHFSSFLENLVMPLYCILPFCCILLHCFIAQLLFYLLLFVVLLYVHTVLAEEFTIRWWFYYAYFFSKTKLGEIGKIQVRSDWVDLLALVLMRRALDPLVRMLRSS
jgi:hypothetical protein